MQRYRALAMLLTAIVSSPTTRSAYARARPKNMCLMQYLVADNDLEYAITADLLELIDSEFIRQPNVQTWVYYDAHGDMDDYDGDGFNDAPLSDDAAPTILWFDHVSEQLGVVQKFVESNSDTIAVLSYFLARALTDCIKNGAEEFVLTFSSHGGGHIGFGGDMNIGAGRRRLYQSNQNIASGMQYALQQVDGAPSKFDLVGFDACLMSSFLAVREYAPLTTHILASEATVPGHGWYWNIPSSAANSAFSMGIELHSLYLSETQAPYSYTESQNSTSVETHKTPKTLALIDTVGFDAFLVAFERFARELTKVLKASNDQNFFASIQRTRNGIMAFEASDDQPGTSHPSAVDIGSFLVVFREKCNPIPLTAISTALEDAIATYDALFVVRGVGPGTKPATGMSVYFPSKK